MAETILIVDDEEPVRRTFGEWIESSGWGVRLLSAPDPEQALKFANSTTVDLAVLDWNLGTGTDGLQLLEDLSVFQPDLVAILVTGFAHQATPLAALRMGVRDYLDKNQDLSRESFLKAVRRQLDRIVPIKKHRAIHRGLEEFRQSVQKILPLVETSAVSSDPVPLPHAVSALSRFLMRLTGAADAVVVLRRFTEVESQKAYLADGTLVNGPLAPFAATLAASAASLGEPSVLANLAETAGVALQPFEKNRANVLVVPLAFGGGDTAVLELFDKPGGFTPADRALASAGMEIGGELIRHAVGERQTQGTLAAAIRAALKATEGLGESSGDLSPSVRDSLKEQMGGARLELAEAIQQLNERHGEKALEHCAQMLRSLLDLLDH